ncbi:MAG: elongation factor G [bacterium JZ-2024 1]
MIRNFALIGHNGSGKTTLAEALLYFSGATKRLGRVDDGTSLLDYLPEEIERKGTFMLSVGHFTYEGMTFHFLDLPGFLDFAGDVVCGMSATDNLIFTINAESGVEVGTEQYWEWSESRKIPRLIVVTHCGSVKAKEVLSDIRSLLGNSCVPLQYPSGWGSEFLSVRSILSPESEIPPQEKNLFSERKEMLLEALSVYSDAIAEKYLEGKPLFPEELHPVLRSAFREAQIFPIFYVDSLTQVGIKELLDQGMVPLLTAPEENPIYVALQESHPDARVGFVFKTVLDPHLGEVYYVRSIQGKFTPDTYFNIRRKETEKVTQFYQIQGKERKEIPLVQHPGEIFALAKLKTLSTGDTLASSPSIPPLEPIEFPTPTSFEAIVPRSRGDEERFSEALTKLQREDPSFTFSYNPELKQFIIHSLGEVHFSLIQYRMKQRFNVEVVTEKPRVPYRETIRKKAEAMGKYVRQSGGRGQYGICFLRVEPRNRGEGYEFVNDIFGGAIPAGFIPSVEVGVRKAMERGVLCGCPVVDVRVVLFDGKYHEVDSSNIAFELAGSLGFKEAQRNADPYLLEPFYLVEVTVPEENMGDIIGDLNARRGRMLGMETRGGKSVIKAYVPYAELYKYSNTIKSITRGKGTFSMRFSHYEEVPKEIAVRLIPELRKERGVETGESE